MNSNRRNQRPEQIERNFQYITLIWLDENINDTDESNQTQRLLCELNDSVQFYTNPYLCFDYLKSLVNEKILLIISGVLLKQYLPTIQSFTNIYSIFLFCNDRLEYISILNEYPNIIEIYTDEIHLIRSVSDNIHSVLKRTLAFTLLDSKIQKSTRDSVSALWFQLLLDILKKLPHTDQAKNEMLDKCAEYYQSCLRELQKIQQFREEYIPSKAIQWYTSECFLYKLLNKALRSEDIDLLYLFRFYIVDLCSQLEDEHNKQNSDNKNELILYRGQIISSNELKLIKDNSDMQISTNSFMSTTKNPNIALTFVADFKDTQQWKRVLFQIKIYPNLKSVIYADISKLSQNEDEEEILFNLGTEFKILSVFYDDKLNTWKIEMIPIDNTCKNLQDFLNLKENELKSYSSTIVFGRLLFYELGKTEAAKNFFQILLNTLPNDHEDRPSVYHNLGSVYRQKKEFSLALDYYFKAYHLRQERYDPNHPHIASSLRNIGLIYYGKEDYHTALIHLHDALKIEERNHLDNDENIAVTMVHIGMAYNGKKVFVLALKYLLNAYEMYCRIMPKGHPDIGWTAANIGQSYEDQENYHKALHYYLEAYEINEKILSSDHQDLTLDLNRIVNCYLKKGEDDIALSFSQQKLEEQMLKLIENHSRIAYTLQTIANIHQSRNRFEDSLDYYERSLNIFKQCLPLEQEPIIECLISKSQLYFKHKKFQDALNIRLEVLSLQEKLYSSHHIDIAVSLLFIGRLCKYNQNYSEALQYFEKSLKIYQENYEFDHVDIESVFNEIQLTNNQLQSNQ